MFRALKDLEDAITISYCLPYFRENGWTYALRPEAPDCTLDQINGFHYLHQAYSKADPHYTGKVTIPVLWDKTTNKIVNNEFVRNHPHAEQRVCRRRRQRQGFLPRRRCALRSTRSTITFTPTSTMAFIEPASHARRQPMTKHTTHCSRRSTNSKSGSPASAILSATRRPKPTGGCFRHSRVSMSPISRSSSATGSDCPSFKNLWRYTRDLYATPKIAATVKPRLYVQNYYSLERVNPNGIIPKGTPVDFAA